MRNGMGAVACLSARSGPLQVSSEHTAAQQQHLGAVSQLQARLAAATGEHMGHAQPLQTWPTSVSQPLTPQGHSWDASDTGLTRAELMHSQLLRQPMDECWYADPG